METPGDKSRNLENHKIKKPICNKRFLIIGFLLSVIIGLSSFRRTWSRRSPCARAASRAWRKLPPFVQLALLLNPGLRPSLSCAEPPCSFSTIPLKRGLMVVRTFGSSSAAELLLWEAVGSVYSLLWVVSCGFAYGHLTDNKKLWK